jgi:dihydroorotate dehydrogenase (NAD+) catalytic subunit
MPEKEIDLSIEIGSIKLGNPVLVASGTFGYGEEFSSLIDINQLGAVVTKGISIKPLNGNPSPRIVETPSGMLNSVGLQNVGFDKFVSDKMPFLRKFRTPVIVNFFGSTVEEYSELARKLSDIEGVAGLEANISCPNIKEGGMCFGTDASMTYRITRQIRRATSHTVIIKLSPNVTDISLIAKSAEEAGADAVSVANTYTGMVVDIDTCRPALANITGGLSGPAIRPLSLKMVWQTVKKVSIPVIGIGGIKDGKDALQYLIAGAKAVQIGTGLFVDPNAPCSIIEEIKGYLKSRGYDNVLQIIGCLKTS